MSMKMFLSVLVAFSLLFNNAALAAVDQEAPEITNVQVSSVTETSVTVSWETDEDSDSLVNYGLQPDYGILRKPVAERTAHTMTLEDLEPGRVYYFRVVSADEEGNQGISADYRVQTSGSAESGDGNGSGQETESGQ
ncbi:MAG: fibronectin type III domain-containing protein, partial [Patescibacteria group bacterium]